MEIMENRERLEEYREKARKLVEQMTLEEKVGQTLYNAPAIPRLGIKAYNWWNEALHGVARAGVATVFPQAIGLAASFDEDFVEEVADAISTEGRAKYNMQQKFDDTERYKGLTFWAPNVNIFRDPRWGRGHETFGEDPYLSSRLGVRFVQGLQGHDENVYKAAACAKHFAVHSGPEDLRHEFNVDVDKQDLYETYLPAFKACVQEGHVETVMGAYNRVDGAPCCGSSMLLQEILRKEWGFEGHVVSDCGAIKDFYQHHMVVDTPVEAAAMAMKNGCDLNCGNLFQYLTQAVSEGLVEESRLDEAVVNLLTARAKLGILDQKEHSVYDEISYEVVDSTSMQKLNQEAAARSIVLLKNEGNLLPLDKKKIRTIGVIGPNADNRKALVGNYEGTASHYWTILEGLQDYLGDSTRILYSQGCHLCHVPKKGGGDDRSAEVKAVCEGSDVIIACMGLDASLEGEQGDANNEFASGDKPNLNLPGRQQEILEIICASGKPVVLVLLSGSALAVTWAQEHVAAIVQGWYPGAMGGKAIAEVLFGDRSPEGKLPVTYYKTTEELPEFTDYHMKGRTYRYMEQEALYPFGYGLSYTSFDFESVAADTETVTEAGVGLTVHVKNTGAMPGRETIQVYVKIEKDGTPNAQLKALQKIALEPGEVREVSLRLPKEAFGLYDENGRFVYYPGQAKVYVGGQAPDERSSRLTGRKVAELQVRIEE